MGPVEAHRLQRNLILSFILLPAVVCVALLVYSEWNWYPRPQPINFDHRLHAAYTKVKTEDGAEKVWSGVFTVGQLAPDKKRIVSAEVHGGAKIDCTYCHRGARSGYTAGIIAVEDCLACHRGLTNAPQGKTRVTERPQVKKLVSDYGDEFKGVRWFKYYDLPEHVKFPHYAHTVVAGIDCARCHGQVYNSGQSEMKSWNMLHKPTMGWCVSCHRQEGGPEDCTTCHR